MPKRGVGVVVGRFQVPRLHEGHKDLINAASGCDKVLVCVGVGSRPGSVPDPLDYPTREHMIKQDYPYAMVVPLPDVAGNDAAWSQALDKLIAALFPTDPVTLFHGRDSFASAYTGRNKVREIEEVPNVSGTALREEVGRCVFGGEAFRRGVIYGVTNQWPRIDPVVDICVWRKLEGCPIEILVGKRHGEDGYRFPGGHVDVADESGEAAARRELFEETGLTAEDWKLLDQPRCKLRDAPGYAMFTTLFLARYTHGPAFPGSDLDEVMWLQIDRARQLDWADGHALLAITAFKALEGI